MADFSPSTSVRTSGLGRLIVYAVDSTVAIRLEDGTVVDDVSVGDTVEDTPMVVTLADGNTYVFVTTHGGYLYSLRIVGIGSVISSSRRLVRSTAVCSGDSLQASPSLQLQAYSNGSFTAGRDLLFVITHYGCGDHSQNKVIAVDAEDIGTTVWTFNAFNEYQMDYGSAGCIVDYDANRIYCATHLDPGRYQNTMWAINTNDGALAWAHNYNSIHSRPFLSFRNRHLYVADTLGTVHSLDVDDGTDPGKEDWSLYLSALSSAMSVEQPVWGEFRSPYSDLLFVTDTLGVLHAVWDGGASLGGYELWTSNAGASVTSLAAVSPSLGKIFVGTNVGQIKQLDIATGSPEAIRTIGTSSDVVADPLLYVSDPSSPGATIDNLVAASSYASTGMQIKQFCAPFTVGSSGTSLQDCRGDADCLQLNSPAGCKESGPQYCCAVGRCNILKGQRSGTCHSQPSSERKPCDPGHACIPVASCNPQGFCLGKWSTSSACTDGRNCDTHPTQACGEGRACLWNQFTRRWNCASLSSNDSCGGARACASPDLELGWGGDRVCNKDHVCERDTGACSAPSAGDFNSSVPGGVPALRNAVGLGFLRDGSECSAFLSTYDTQTATPQSFEKTVTGFTGSSGCSPALCSSMGASSATTVQCVPGTPPACCSVPVVEMGCQGQPQCLFTPPVCTSTAAVAFTDPTPKGVKKPNVTQFNVRVYGRGANSGCVSSQTGRMWVKINGNNLPGGGTGGAFDVTASCACSTCSLLASYSASSPPTGWVSGGSNTVQVNPYVLISTSDGVWQIAAVEIEVVHNLVTNYVRRVEFGGTGNTVHDVGVYPGYMSGVTVVPNNSGALGEIFTSFVSRGVNPNPVTFDGMGRKHNTDFAVGELPLALGNTSCGGASCPFLRAEFNLGPTPPVSDGQPVLNGLLDGPGSVYVGNYAANGDVMRIQYGVGGWVAQSALGGAPPWCGGGGCAASDRVTAVALPPATNPKSDGLLKVAHGTFVEFIRVSTGEVVDRINLRSSADPILGPTLGDPLQAGGVGPWAAAGFSNIVAITGLTADPLNGTNDLYAEVREMRSGNPRTFIVHIRGDDHTVRPLGPYQAIAAPVSRIGVLNDMHVTTNVPPNHFTDEGRVTSDALVRLYRLVPADTAVTANSTVANYSMAP